MDSRGGRPVGFVKEVRVFPVLMVEGDDTFGVDVLGITLVARCAAEVERVPDESAPQIRFAAQSRPVLLVNVGLVFFRLGPIARIRSTEGIVRV